MRIAMLADMYTPHTSGITNHIALTKAALTALGHEVYVFTFGNLDHVDAENNVVRSPGIPYGKTGYNFGLGYTREAERVLATMDVLHVHHPFMSGRFALKLKRRNGTPVVFTNHTRYDIYAGVYARLVPRAISRAYVAAYLRRFCSQVDAVISPSQGVAEVLRDFGVTEPIDVVPNGVDLAPFRDAEPIPRAELDLPDDAVVFAYLGRLGGEKRPLYLLGCFGAVASRDPRVALLFIGGGPEQERLERMVRSEKLTHRVKFTGPVPYRDVPSYIAACDVSATASVSEVHPLTLIESMAAGLPLLGVESPGVGDVIEHEHTGLLTADDPVVFTEAMARLGSDDELRRRLGDSASVRAEELDIGRTVPRLLDVYERAARMRA